MLIYFRFREELFRKLHFYEEEMKGIEIQDNFISLSTASYSLTNKSITLLESEVERLSQEYQRRVQTVQEDAIQIVKLWAQLGTSQHNIDRDILSCYKDRPEQLGLTDLDLERLNAKRVILQRETDERIEHLSTIKAEVTHLWQKLSEEEQYVKAFDRANRGIALHVIETVRCFI